MARINAINNQSSQLTIDPGASGDSFVQFNINATGEFRIGVDDTDDSFRISQGSALGTNDAFIVTASGEITKPLQPAFLVVLTTTKSNQTGAGTSYTISWDSEIIDQGGDFSTTTFTSPVTGRYRFDYSILLGGIVSATVGLSLITTSNRTYRFQYGSPSACDSSSNQLSLSSGSLADMDAADTATLSIEVSGEASDVIDILSNGATDPYTWWSGNLEV